MRQPFYYSPPPFKVVVILIPTVICNKIERKSFIYNRELRNNAYHSMIQRMPKAYQGSNAIFQTFQIMIALHNSLKWLSSIFVDIPLKIFIHFQQFIL